MDQWGITCAYLCTLDDDSTIGSDLHVLGELLAEELARFWTGMKHTINPM